MVCYEHRYWCNTNPNLGAIVMILSAFIIILMAGGILAWIAERWNPILSRWISLLALLFNLATALLLWTEQGYLIERSHSSWLAKYEVPWIPIFGISFNLALDGLSLLMLLLTFLLGIFALLTSWREIQYKIGFFHFNLLWVLAGITGVFLTMDLFLFYFLIYFKIQNTNKIHSEHAILFSFWSR